MQRNTIKAVFILLALLTAMYCNYRAASLDRQARSLAEEIMTIRRAYLNDSSGNAVDRAVEPLEATRLDYVQKSQELNHLFIYMISGFLGLAISVAADIFGHPSPGDSPPQKDNGKS